MTDRTLVASAFLFAVLSACTSENIREPEMPLEIAAETFRLGLDAYERDRFRTAFSYFSESLADYRSVDNIEGMLRCLINRAEAALALYRQDLATASLADAHRLLRYDTAPEFNDRITYLEARVAAREGRHEIAANQLATLLGDETAPPSLLAAARLQQARLAMEAGDVEAAQQVRQARKHLSNIAGYQPSLALLQADYLKTDGSYESATELYAEALRGFRQQQNRLGIAATYESWGRLLLSRNAWGDAKDRLMRALTIRLWMGDRLRSMAIIDNLMTIANEQNNKTHLDKLKQWRNVLEQNDNIMTTSDDTWAKILP